MGLSLAEIIVNMLTFHANSQSKQIRIISGMIFSEGDHWMMS